MNRPSVPLTAEQLTDAYLQGRDVGVIRYPGEDLLVTGRVTSVKLSGVDTIVTLRCRDGMDVKCEFTKVPAVPGLKQDQTVTIFGSFTGMAVYPQPLLRYCRLYAP